MNFNPPQSTTGSKLGLNKPKFNTIEVIFLIILIAILVWYFIKPKMATYAAKKDELTTVETDLKQLSERDKEIQELYELLQTPEIKNDIELLDEGVPLNSRATRVYMLMESLIKNSGMVAGSLSVEPLDSLVSEGASDKSKDVFNENRVEVIQKISLNLSGNMQQFLGFLEILENNPRLFNIKNLSINGEDKQALAFKLLIEVFAYAK